MAFYEPRQIKADVPTLDESIAQMVILLNEAWDRFNAAEEEVVEETIYEIKMLEARFSRLTKEKRGAE